ASASAAPVTLAMLAAQARWAGMVGVWLIEAPLGRSRMVLAQPPVSGSVTVTLLRSTSPVLVTLIVKVTVSPSRTTLSSGDFTIAIAGCRIASSGSQGRVAPL